MTNHFGTHLLNETGIAKAEAIGAAFEGLLRQLEVECFSIMPSREFSLCKTKLEEACFYAKKTMASQPENQQAEAAQS